MLFNENPHINFQPEAVCPVSGLPIKTKPEWTSISVDGHYSNKFSLIGSSVLYGQGYGYARIQDAKNALDLIEKVQKESIPPGQPYIHISDYSNLRGNSPEARRLFIDGFKNNDQLVGVILLGLTPILNLSVRLARRLYIIKYKVHIAKSYADAIKLALDILSDNKTPTANSGMKPDADLKSYSQKSKKICDDCETVYKSAERTLTLTECMQADRSLVLMPQEELALELDGYSARYKIIGGKIIHATAKGYLKEEYIPHVFRMHEKLACFLTASGGDYYLISDITKLDGASRLAIKLYLKKLKEWHARHPFRSLCFYGGDWSIQAAANLAKPFVPFKIHIAKDLSSALKRIDQDHVGGTDTSCGKMALKKRSPASTENYVEELLRFVATIDWENDGFEETDAVDPAHPFKAVFDAVRLIKMDLDSLFHDQRRAEEALRVSEERYRDIFNNVSEFLYLHDLKGYFADTNDAWKRAYGYTDDELTGLCIGNLILAEHSAEFDAYLKRIIENGSDEGLIKIKVKYGHVRILEYRNSLVSDKSGPVCVRGSARDITEKIEAEKTIRRSEEKYRTILENIEEGYYEVDTQRRLTFFNDSMCRIFGYSRDEMMGKNLQDFLEGGSTESVNGVFNKVADSAVPEKGVDWKLTTKDGTRRYVETSLSLVQGANGVIIGFRGTLRDITARKMAEEKIKRYSEGLEEMVQSRTEDLRKSEEKYRTILENIEDGYYEVNIEGHFTFFNDSLCNIAGYSRDELISLTFQDITAGNKFGEVKSHFSNVLKTSLPLKRFDWEIRTKDGCQKFAEGSISPIQHPENGVVGFRGILRDVTERKNLELELIEKRRQAIASNNAKSEFLANMSHEIRTPLNGIIGMAEMGAETELDPEQCHIINTIKTESEALLGIVNNILDFSKIEAEKLEIEKAPFDLRLLLSDITNIMSFMAENKGLNFRCDIGPDVPSLLIGDPGRLRQVLMNLTGNAVKFTDEGKVIIECHTTDSIQDTTKLRFSISDTGIGISREKQEKIFESFTQADGSTTRRYGGTGLGTTISKQLVGLMGGEIGLTSEIGSGSTFWFTVTLGVQKNQAGMPAKHDRSLEGLKILVFKNNDVDRFPIIHWLESWGCLPLALDVGPDALSGLDALGPPNLIIIDHRSPDIDGFGLSKKIRSKPELKDIPIILLAASGTPGDGRRCKESDIQGYLTQAISKDILCNAIEMVLENRIPRKSSAFASPVTRYSIAENLNRKPRILLVEDYPTNQQIAMHHLKKAGYQVELAENGQQAVELFKRRPYDVILMDIQTPLMDGYEAARAIRALERQSGVFIAEDKQPLDDRIPIIAMTAHAIKGYRQKCIRAGMNDYISKPLKRMELLAIVDKWTDSNRTKFAVRKQAIEKERRQTALENLGNVAETMDYERALEEFEDDRDFLKLVLEGFLQKLPAQIDVMEQAISEGRTDLIKTEAHAIKGGAANLHALELAQLATTLEADGKNGCLDHSKEALSDLREATARLQIFAAEHFVASLTN